MVGEIDEEEDEILFGKVFAKYFDEPNSVFIISSDFCHCI